MPGLLPSPRRVGTALLVCGALLLAGCTAEPEPAPSVPVPAPDASATAPVESAPVLVADGSATDNLPLFAQVVSTVAAGADAASGRAYVDALTAAGFDKSAMQVTADASTVGNPAESIQFSVRWGDECLVGQVGPATGAPVAVVLPGLATGACLVGTTRTIDW